MLHVESFSTEFSNQDTKELLLLIRFFISFMVTVKMDVELFKHVSLSRGSLHALGHVQHSCIFVIERKVRKKLEEAIVHVNGFHVNFWKILFV